MTDNRPQCVSGLHPALECAIVIESCNPAGGLASAKPPKIVKNTTAALNKQRLSDIVPVTKIHALACLVGQSVHAAASQVHSRLAVCVSRLRLGLVQPSAHGGLADQAHSLIWLVHCRAPKAKAQAEVSRRSWRPHCHLSWCSTCVLTTPTRSKIAGRPGVRLCLRNDGKLRREAVATDRDGRLITAAALPVCGGVAALSPEQKVEIYPRRTNDVQKATAPKHCP